MPLDLIQTASWCHDVTRQYDAIFWTFNLDREHLKIRASLNNRHCEKVLAYSALGTLDSKDVLSVTIKQMAHSFLRAA